MSAELEAIRKRFDAIIPGPWRWYGNTATDQVYLATTNRGRLIILTPSTRVEEYVYDHHEMETYTIEDARAHFKQRWCFAHADHVDEDDTGRCLCDELSAFLTQELNPSGDGASFSDEDRGYKVWLTHANAVHEDLRFAVPFKPPGNDRDWAEYRKEHGGVLKSYRDMAKFEVLGYRTQQEWVMDQGGVVPNASGDIRDVLYREDFCGLDNPEAEFIAHAPEDIGYLLAEIDRLRGLNPKGSLSYECPECGAEVDIREAETL